MATSATAHSSLSTLHDSQMSIDGEKRSSSELHDDNGHDRDPEKREDASGETPHSPHPPARDVEEGILPTDDLGDPMNRDSLAPGQDDDSLSSADENANVISRILSRTSTNPTRSLGPPPDGGLRAWLAVLGGHLVVMNTWGIIGSFGVFQTYYATALAPLPPSTISWIGSVQIFLLFLLGGLTGHATDHGYFIHLYVLGSALQLLGIFAASAADGTFWQLMLSQGICLGLGNGCVFCPALAVLAPYWSKRRMIAIGIAACGTATGGLIFPSMVRQLLPSVGFGWTMRAIGFVQLGTIIVAGFCLKPRIPPRKGGRLVELAAFKELEYTFYATGSFFAFWGLYFAFYYLASFSRDIIGLSYTDSLNLLLVLNGVGAFGRLIPNYFADRIGPITTFAPAMVAAGTCVLCWMAVKSPAGLYVWAAFYGFAAGGIQSLFPAGLSSLTTDLRKTGVRMGMVFTIVSFATLTGPPIEGALQRGGGYNAAFAFAGAVLLLGAGFMAAARWVRMRREGKGWRIKV